ncbi:MAG: hypothetical protein ABWX65_06625, partial [Mycetocola sp.]
SVESRRFLIAAMSVRDAAERTEERKATADMVSPLRIVAGTRPREMSNDFGRDTRPLVNSEARISQFGKRLPISTRTFAAGGSAFDDDRAARHSFTRRECRVSGRESRIRDG